MGNGYPTFVTVLLAFLVLSLQHTLLILRLWVLFPSKSRPGFLHLCQGFLFGQVLGLFTLSGSGDVYRLVSFRKSALGFPCALPTRIAVLLTDKLLEVSVLVSLMIYMGLSMDALRGPTFLKIFGNLGNLVCCLGLATSVAFIFGVLWRYRLSTKESRENLLQTLHSLVSIVKPARITVGLLLSVLVWGGELLAILFLTTAHHLSVQQGIVVLLALSLGTAIPAPLGKLGVHEAAMTLGLVKVGIPTKVALFIAVTHHVVFVSALLSSAGIVFCIGRYKSLFSKSPLPNESESVAKF